MTQGRGPKGLAELAVGALCAAAVGMAWAGVGADAAPAAKGFDKTSGESLAWPLPWTVGTTLVYDQFFESTERSGDERVHFSGTDVIEIAVVQGADGGLLQRWTGREPTLSGDGLPGPMRPVMEAALESFRDLTLDVALNEDGSYRAITNLDRLLPAYRGVMEQAMEAGMSAAAEAGDTDAPEPTPGHRQAMATMLEAMTSPAVVEPELASTPAALNYVATGGLVPGRRYIFQDTYDNPLGEGEISARQTLIMAPAPGEPGRMHLEWTTQPDPSAVAVALEAFVRATLAQASSEELEKAIEGLAENAHFSTRVDYEIDVATGRVLRMEMVETHHLQDRESVDVTRMTLRR